MSLLMVSRGCVSTVVGIKRMCYLEKLLRLVLPTQARRETTALRKFVMSEESKHRISNRSTVRIQIHKLNQLSPTNQISPTVPVSFSFMHIP